MLTKQEILACINGFQILYGQPPENLSTHMCSQCSHASVGLTQARLNVFIHFNLNGVGTVAAVVALATTLFKP